jgi:hypothetical protein
MEHYLLIRTVGVEIGPLTPERKTQIEQWSQSKIGIDDGAIMHSTHQGTPNAVAREFIRCFDPRWRKPITGAVYVTNVETISLPLFVAAMHRTISIAETELANQGEMLGAYRQASE